MTNHGARSRAELGILKLRCGNMVRDSPTLVCKKIDLEPLTIIHVFLLHVPWDVHFMVHNLNWAICGNIGNG